MNLLFLGRCRLRQRNLYKIYKNVYLRFLLGLICIYVYCQYVIYYVTQIQCSWPTLKSESKSLKPVYAMVVADPHLLGKRTGHWWDRWHREWQMHRAFETAITLHKPDVVFFLGDLFDEGQWASDKEFQEYVQTFDEVFKVPDEIPIYAVVGNHDIGFHYSKKLKWKMKSLGPVVSSMYNRITPHLAGRFETMFDAPPVKLVSIRGNHFVLINSMAMEGDGCGLCSRAEIQIDEIADILKCTTGSPLCKGKKRLDTYSRPIIMQHYPLYRESDTMCTDIDAAPLPQRNSLFEERWDCLSKESTEFLVESLFPRAAFGGHTHHSCVVRHSFAPTPEHKLDFMEYTVPSFSWKNRLDPKYYLVTVSPHEVRVSKCGVPSERTLQLTAILMVLALLVYLRYFNITDKLFNYKQ